MSATLTMVVAENVARAIEDRPRPLTVNELAAVAGILKVSPAVLVQTGRPPLDLEALSLR